MVAGMDVGVVAGLTRVYRVQGWIREGFQVLDVLTWFGWAVCSLQKTPDTVRLFVNIRTTELQYTFGYPGPVT